MSYRLQHTHHVHGHILYPRRKHTKESGLHCLDFVFFRKKQIFKNQFKNQTHQILFVFVPFGHFANKALMFIFVAQMRLISSYGRSSPQIHFGCFPLLLAGHEKSFALATKLALATINIKLNIKHLWKIPFDLRMRKKSENYISYFQTKKNCDSLILKANLMLRATNHFCSSDK